VYNCLKETFAGKVFEDIKDLVMENIETHDSDTSLFERVHFFLFKRAVNQSPSAESFLRSFAWVLVENMKMKKMKLLRKL
jgi:hypothetical protein